MKFAINWTTSGQVMVNIEAVKNKKKNRAHICTTYSTYVLKWRVVFFLRKRTYLRAQKRLSVLSMVVLPPCSERYTNCLSIIYLSILKVWKAWFTSRNHLYPEFSANICRCIAFAPHGCPTFSRASKWSDVWKWRKNGYRVSKGIVIYIQSDHVWLKVGPLYWPQKQVWKGLDGILLSEDQKSTPAEIGWQRHVMRVFGIQGVIYQHVVPPKTKINAVSYLQVLKLLQKHINKKIQAIARSWILDQNNVRPHVASIVCNFLEKREIPTVAHPLYSSDHAPCDF